MPGPQPGEVAFGLNDPHTAALTGLLTELRAAARSLADLTHVVDQLDEPADPPDAYAGTGAVRLVTPDAASEPASSVPGRLLPPWLTDVDARWQRARRTLLEAARVGADELHALHSRCTAAPRAKHDSESESDISGRPTVVLRLLAGSARPAPPTQLPVWDRGTSPTPTGDANAADDADDADAADAAIELWADRVYACTEALHVLHSARLAGVAPSELVEPYWTWIQGHRRRWQALHDDAITVLDALHALHARDAHQAAPRLAVDDLERLHPARYLSGVRAQYAAQPGREPGRRDQPGQDNPGLGTAPTPPALRPRPSRGPCPADPPQPAADRDPLDLLDAETVQLNAQAQAEPRPEDHPDRRPPLRLTTFGAFVLERLTRSQPDTTPRRQQERWEPLTGVTVKAQELLLYLAAHPKGVRRDALIAALWPDAHRDRPTNALNTTLYRLRGTLDPRPRAGAGRRTGRRAETEGAHERALVARNGAVYYLDPAVVEVDYWTFLHAARALRATPDQPVGVMAALTVTETYQGPFAADLTGAWVESLRIDAHKQHLRAVFALIEHYAHHDPTPHPGLVMAVLEEARNLHPGQEHIACVIMQIHADRGHPDLVSGAYDILASQLADLDDKPSRETRDIHRRLLATARQRATATSTSRRSAE